MNTLDDRHLSDRQPKELLATYIDLARFGEDTQILSDSEVDQLFERSYTDREGAAGGLKAARELREAIHDVFWAIINKRPAPPMALPRLNIYAQDAAAHMQVVAVKDGFEWQYDNLLGFESVLWPIARSAVNLLASDQLEFVRACSAKNCEWLFLDTSKNHQRRWCDMTKCGNRAKVSAFYRRRQKTN